jgi:methionine sulfoxide reductase heme-binding subunit
MASVTRKERCDGNESEQKQVSDDAVSGAVGERAELHPAVRGDEGGGRRDFIEHRRRHDAAGAACVGTAEHNVERHIGYCGGRDTNADWQQRVELKLIHLDEGRRHSDNGGDDVHEDEGVVTTPEQALEESQPSAFQIGAPLAAFAVVLAVVASGADSQTVWYVIRATGVIAYSLLAASVIVGLLITGRAVPGGRPRVDVYEVHTFTSLLALAFGTTHALTLLLDNFVTFSPVQVFVPFTSSYRPVSVALGVFSLYAIAVIYGSFWARRYIGYRRWRLLHYGTFAAFVLVTVHGILSGADAHTAWLVLIFSVASAAVLGLTIYRILSVQPRKRATA